MVHQSPAERSSYRPVKTGIDHRLSSAGTTRWFALLVTLGTVSVFQGILVGIVAALSLACTSVVLPKRNPLLYWPIGLLIAVLSLYVFYICLWALGTQGIGTRKAEVFLLSVLWTYSAIGWRLRTRRDRDATTGSDYTIHWSGGVLISFVSAGVILFGLWNYFHRPQALIGNFLAGGDHGLHLEFIVDLIKGSPQLSYTSPLSLQDYPKGIHFFVANLLAINLGRSGDLTIIQWHKVPALFEYVQLAAFAHLMVLGGLQVTVKHQLLRTYVVATVLIAVISVPHLVNHLFWSGFTTSLALAWILLVPIVFPWRDWIGTVGWVVPLRVLGFWTLMSLAVWIVYQPYVLIPGAILSGLIICYAGENRGADRRIARAGVRRVALQVAVPLSIAAAPWCTLLVQGKNSASLQRLVLFGVSWRISVCVSLAASAAGLTAIFISRKTDNREVWSIADPGILSGVTALMVSMLLLAAYVSPSFTISASPYYVQKMFWTTFFVAMAVVIKWAVPAVEKLVSVRTGRSRRLVLSLVILGVGILPSAWNGTPRDSLDRISIDWLAQDMFVNMSDVQPYRAVVFNTWDNLGAHVGNIAIRRFSPTPLPIDIAQSRDSVLACWYMRENDINVVFTATGQSLGLVESGCDQYANYVESGTRVGHLILKTPMMPLNKVVRTSSMTSGSKFLLTGFSEAAVWGSWADGFHSTLQMMSPRDIEEGTVSLWTRNADTMMLPARIEVHVNGAKISSKLANRSLGVTTMALPVVKPGDVVSFQVVCQRNIDEVLATSNNQEASKCLGLRAFEVRA